MSLVRRVITAALVAIATLAPNIATAGEHGSAYVANGKCGPFPRAVVTTPPWACLGIVAGPDDGLIMPRNVLEVAPGRLLLIDMGGWEPGIGRLIEVRIGADGSRKVTTLLKGLDRPHGLALGPDGKVYVGEAKTIWRFDPKSEKITRETIIDGLPSTGRHPLKHFVFDNTGDLILNEGAPSDRCEREGQALSTVQFPCPAVTGDKPEAALWRLHFDHPGGKLASFEPIARGLRNSMAIAVEPRSGLIVQANNNIDYRPDNDPPETLNVVKQGGNYGWPYCTFEGPGQKLGIVQGYERFAGKINCAKFDQPTVLVPAHGAPLGMLYYEAAMFPELKGKLIVGLHGYRSNGHRIVAYDRAPDGTPLVPKGSQPAFPLQLVTGWDDRPNVHPMGAPVNLSVGTQGQIWFTEDRNRTLMVLLRGEATADAGGTESVAVKVLTPPPSWAHLSATVSPTCGQCHDDFRARTTYGVWANLVRRGWIDQADKKGSLMVKALRGEAPLKPMPPPGGIRQVPGAETALAAFLAGP